MLYGKRPHVRLALLVAAIAFCIGAAAGVTADTEQAKEHYNAGIKAMQEGKTDEAILSYLAAITADPEYIDAYINVGAIYFEQQDYDKALDLFQKAVERDGKNVMALSNLGRVNYILKRYVEAETAFKQAIAVDDKDASLYRGLGKTYNMNKNYPKVVETIEKCHELGGGDDYTYYILGRAYKSRGKMNEAIAAFKKSNEIKNTYNAHSSLGAIYLSQEKFILAGQEFKAALKVNPKAHRAAYNYAIAVQSQDPENYDTNIKAWQDYIKIAKSNPRAKAQVAEAERVIKDLRAAKEQADLQ